MLWVEISDQRQMKDANLAQLKRAVRKMTSNQCVTLIAQCFLVEFKMQPRFAIVYGLPGSSASSMAS